MKICHLRSSPKIEYIVTNFNLYKEMESHPLIIAVMDPKSQMKYADKIRELFSQNNIAYRLGGSKITALPIKDCRKAIDCLYHNEFISIEDRAFIEEYIKKIESEIALTENLSSSLVKSQKNILKTLFIEVFIEDVLDISKDINDVLMCMNFILKFDNSDWLTRNDLKKMNVAEKNIQPLFDSLMGISKCYHGRASLESALIQSGPGIPTLNLQKDLILAIIKKAFFNKFPDLDNKTYFLTTLAFNVLRLGSPIAKNDKQNQHNLNNILDVVELLKSVNYVGPKYISKLWAGCMTHEAFIKLITDTFNETGLSLNDIGITTRLRVSKMYQESLSILCEKSMTNGLRHFNLNLNDVLNKKIDEAKKVLPEKFNQPNENKAKSPTFFQELQNHQRDIQEGTFLAKNKMRKKCAEAAERRLNNNSF